MNRLGRLLMLWSSKAILQPAGGSNDVAGTVTLLDGGMTRESISKGEFMFTGAVWIKPEAAVIWNSHSKTGAAAGAADGRGNGRKVLNFGDAGGRHLLGVQMPALPPHGGSQQIKNGLDKRIYKTFWRAIWKSMSESGNFDAKSPTSLLTYGKELAAVGMKLSKEMEVGTLMMVIPMGVGDPDWATVEHLAGEMSLEQSLFGKVFDEQVVQKLYSIPDRIRFQLLGAEIFLTMASLGSQFPLHFGRVLALAETTFLTVIPPETLVAVNAFMHPESSTSGSAVFPGFVHQALTAVGITNFTISVVNQPSSRKKDASALAMRLLRIDIFEGKRDVTVDCNGRSMSMEHTAGATSLNAIGTAYPPINLYRSGKYASLEFQMVLGISDGPLRHKLFKQVVAMPMMDDMCPVNILVNNGILFPSKLLSAKMQTAESIKVARGTVNSDYDSVKDTVRGLASAMETPFSFMQHWSRHGNVSMEVARQFPKDTVISLEPDKSLAEGHWKEIKANKGPMNNIVCNIEPDTKLLVKLIESPEVLRYQFLDWDYIQRFMNDPSGNGLPELGERLGALFATGVSTFIRLPSSRAISVAAAIAYSELTTPDQRQKVLGPSGLALPGLGDLEMRFVFEITKLGSAPAQSFGGWQRGAPAAGAEGVSTLNNVSVTPTIVPPVESNGTIPAWRLLRIDVKSLTLQVNHHFDYRLDGHQRKYQMHIESNSTKDWKVYLTRKHDSWMIPYKEIKSITLIALLRMGLLPDIKDWFYGMFLKLPMYEDMAPWNIVFESGKLEYVTPPLSTSFLVNSRTLMGCTDPRRRGVGATPSVSSRFG